MDTFAEPARPAPSVQCAAVPPAHPVPSLAEDARTGLEERPRSLPPKYFYDERGSELFNRICETPEYYPTRTEAALLRRGSPEIIAQTRPGNIVELGSGNSQKTKNLLDACEQQQHACIYAPFDICEPALVQAGSRLQKKYPWLDVRPLLGDYHAGLSHLPRHRGVSLYLFLGGTLGNFTRTEAAAFIGDLGERMAAGDYLLLGADRIKNPAVLNAAYNDEQGLTARFNLNVLQVLNRELSADFQADNFAHEAAYNEELNRIEMYLSSRVRQEVVIDQLGLRLRLERNEKILTELSYKFHYDELETMLAAPGLDVVRHFEPDNRYFSLVLARKT